MERLGPVGAVAPRALVEALLARAPDGRAIARQLGRRNPRLQCPHMPSVTRKTQNARMVRRDELRDQLLAAAERLMAQGESFTELSVERLVAEVGISRSTFYVYFTDKGDVLSAWFADIAEEIAQALVDWWAIDADSTREDLHDALGRAVGAYLPHVALMASAFHASVYDASVRELTDAFMATNIASLSRHIRTGQKAGFIDESLQARDVAAWLLWMAERGLHVILRGASDAELERQLDAYTAIVWNTLYAPARHARPGR